MEDKILEIVRKFFKPEQIESIKIFGQRAIVTIQTDQEDMVKHEALINELNSAELVNKISVVYTRPKSMPEDKWQVLGVKKIIGVASGKGGVGKSTTAVNLALALASCGVKTAVFDADIYGPSIPMMLGHDGTPPYSEDGKIFMPFDFMGVKFMSIGSIVGNEVPLIWRGAKACGAIQQLICDTDWRDTEVMVIDMPPGTGDIQITLSQKINFDGVVIVSTPQDIALIDAVKGINMFKKIGVPILGIIENMSYYICEKCGNRADIFGHHGAKETAEKMGETFLGEIPLHFDIRENADKGTPIVFAEPESPHTQAYLDAALKIAAKLGIKTDPKA